MYIRLSVVMCVYVLKGHGFGLKPQEFLVNCTFCEAIDVVVPAGVSASLSYRHEKYMLHNVVS